MAPLYLLASHASLALSKPLYCNHSLFWGEEPCRDRGVGHSATPKAEQECQSTSEYVNILPSGQRARRDLTKAIVQRSSDDCKPASTREPPSLPKRLLLLRVITADNCHEARGNHTFNETCGRSEGMMLQPIKGKLPRKKR